jgi:hypothetical protein
MKILTFLYDDFIGDGYTDKDYGKIGGIVSKRRQKLKILNLLPRSNIIVISRNL